MTADLTAMQSLFSMIVEQFEDRLVQILLAVAVLSGVLSFFEDDPKVPRAGEVGLGLVVLTGGG